MRIAVRGVIRAYRGHGMSGMTAQRGRCNVSSRVCRRNLVPNTPAKVTSGAGFRAVRGQSVGWPGRAVLGGIRPFQARNRLVRRGEQLAGPYRSANRIELITFHEQLDVLAKSYTQRVRSRICT